jgi:hypothetical protein
MCAHYSVHQRQKHVQSPPAEAEHDAVDVATEDVVTVELKHLQQEVGKPKVLS